MEDVLEIYQRPSDPSHPLVCMDETHRQQIKETQTPVPERPGKPRRYDYEYERAGVSHLFMLFAPLEGWRHLEVTDHRTRIDWAHCMRDLSDIHFPKADKITIVMDNLNTHSPASLYEAFPPAEARRISERFEFHYTPKHGSWLNIPDIPKMNIHFQPIQIGRSFTIF